MKTYDTYRSSTTINSQNVLLEDTIRIAKHLEHAELTSRPLKTRISKEVENEYVLRNCLNLNQLKERARNTPALAPIFHKCNMVRFPRPTDLTSRNTYRSTDVLSIGSLNRLYSLASFPKPISESYKYLRKSKAQYLRKSLSPCRHFQPLDPPTSLSVKLSLNSRRMNLSNRPSPTRYKFNS